MQKGFTALGLMSGTSMDGVDAAILRTDGVNVLEHGPVGSLTYSDENRDILQNAIAASRHWSGGAEPQAVYKAAATVSDTHARLVRRLLDTASLEPHDIDFIGFHGQTILHRPDQRRTLQAGDAQALADLTGIDVIADFRVEDIEKGGEGAPLAPLYHQALVRSAGLKDPVAVINIGGVANITWIHKDDILAFDTGPGNGPIDEWMVEHAGRAMDENGQIASMGTVDQHALQTMLQSEFFRKKPPKSLDRFDFTSDFVSRLSIEDGAATLTAFTAAAIATGLHHLPEPPSQWIICGGGRHNATLMSELARRLPGDVVPAEKLHWRGDDLEAEAIAFLAVRSWLGLPLSLPTTTGVPEPCTGGKFYKCISE